MRGWVGGRRRGRGGEGGRRKNVAHIVKTTQFGRRDIILLKGRILGQ